MPESTVDTLHSWIFNKIRTALKKKANHNSYILWCDPHRNWKELLALCLANTEINLWAFENHELTLRHKFYTAPDNPVVIWLPVDRSEIGYFMVYALQADQIFQMSIVEALDEFGVDLPVDQIRAVEPILPAHALQWIDYPLSFWKEKFSVGEVKISLVDDETVLAILATPGKPLSEWITPDRLPILNRRVVDDFGLPPLYESQTPPDTALIDLDNWRVRSTAALLVTEADETLPLNPPGDRDRVIHGVAIRNRAIKLLMQWQKQFDLVDAFQEIAAKADGITTLQYWAKNLPEVPPPLSSPVIESTRFQMELETLAHIETYEDLVDYLQHHIDTYQSHANGFWGKRATNYVKWSILVDLAENAIGLRQYAGIEKSWRTIQDAAGWYVEHGWRVDWTGEQLLKENNQLPGALLGVRSRLRQAYLRHLDRINTVFSDLVMNSGKSKPVWQPYAYTGSLVSEAIRANPKQPTAVIVADACRYDIGCRLVEAINMTEPVQRAEVTPACATVPSITPLGMTFALPGLSKQVKIELLPSSAQPWLISTDHFPGNLADAYQRRAWLKQNLKVREQSFLSIDQVINSDSTDALSVKALGRLVFVFDDELDDHDGVLKPFGLDGIIDRYASLVRRLQAAGYSTIHLVTDHGFFHWEPAPDEKDVAKPDGEIIWKSRRAVVGRRLKHPTALVLKIPGSDLEVCIPRSVNSFKTYGGLGFFHGGLTLQEWIIPVVTVRFPHKAQKIGGVLKSITQIVSLAQRVQVGPEAAQLDLFAGQAHENYLSRPVVVKVFHPATGKMIFKSKRAVTLEPGGELATLELMAVPGAAAAFKSELELQLLDADDEEILDRARVTLQIELDDWA